MALDDVIGSVDPNDVVDSLITHATQEMPATGGIDPNDVVDRLTRKVMGRVREPRAGGIRFKVPGEDEEDKGAPDFSSQGTPVEDLPDLSSEGTPAPPPAAPQQQPPAQPMTLGGPGAFGKGLVRGGIGAGADILKGTGVLTSRAPGNPDLMMTGGAPLPPELLQPSTPLPVEKNPIYKAGVDLSKFGDKIAPMTDEERDSILGRAGGAIGGMAPYLALGIVNPAAAFGLGAAGMGLASAGSTFEQAKAKGASDDDAAAAAGLSGAIGGAIGTIPLHMILKPISASPGIAGYAAAKLAQAARSGVTFATLAEAQEYLLEWVAKAYYDPKAGYSPDAKRAIGNLLGGAGLGLLHPVNRRGAAAAAESDTEAAPPESRIGGPAEGGPEGPSSPEEIAEFLRRARETRGAAPEAEPAPKPQTMRDKMDAYMAAREDFNNASEEDILKQAGIDPAGMSDEERVDAVIKAAKGRQSTSEAPPEQPTGTTSTEAQQRETLKRYGWTDEQIDGMSDRARRRAFSEATETGQKPEEKAESAQPETNKAEDIAEGLKGMGKGIGDALIDRLWSKVQAGAVVDVGKRMDPLLYAAKRARTAGGVQTRDQFKAMAQEYGSTVAGKSGEEFQKAMRDLVAKHSKPQSTGTRTEPIRATTGDDVIRAGNTVTEPKSDAQAQAENYQHGHMEIEHLGLTGRNGISIETGAGQERSGKGWKVKLPVAYGRIKGTTGADGQPLDIFIGPHPTSPHVFVIDQHHNEGGFDEHKIMAGFATPRAALRAYGDSYTDGGGNRIGHVVALTPDEFKTWIKSGETTKPFKKEQPSAPDAGLEGRSSSLTEAEGAPSVPKVATQETGGPSPSPAAEMKITTGADGSTSGETLKEGEVLHPARVTAEPTQQHHMQIEAVLGEDYHRVMPVDVARAAEILAEKPGITPEQAFQYAVIENAVAQKFLTHQQAEQAYGPEVNEVLEPGAEGTHRGGEPAEPRGTEPVEGGASGAEETGVVPRGGEDRGKDEHEGRAGAEAEDTEQHDTGRGEPDTGRKTGGEPAEEDAEPTEDAGRANELARQRHRFAMDRATDARWRELIDPDIKDVHPGDIYNAVKLNIGFGELSIKNARALMKESGDDEIPHEESIDILARSKIEKLQGGEAVQFPYKDEQAQGRMWATIVGVEDGYLKVRKRNGIVPTQKLRDLIANPPPPLPEPGSEPEPEKQKIEDAGEKIGGARKDKWIGRGLKETDLKDMTGAELDKFVTKHNVWNKPDYVQAVEDGVEPMAAALIKRIYDRLAVKPNNGKYGNYDLPTLRKHYIDMMTKLRDGFAPLKTADEVKDFTRKFGGNADYTEMSTVYQPGSRLSPIYLSSKDFAAAKRAVEQGFPQAEPWTRLFQVVEQNQYERGADGKVKRDAAGNVISKKAYLVHRKNGGVVSEHETKEAAEAAAKAAYEGLPDERKQGGETPKRPHLDAVNRDGPDYRKGRDVTGEDFVKDFGFRGVEFGNWVAGDERQKVVNLAYDALHDLARVLNVNPKALSLDGTLSVAFGARGRGGRAAAHYEADRTVINMTKLSGAGSLAHEWAHALDHYLGEIDTKAPYGGKVQSVSGWDTEPKDVGKHYTNRDFLGQKLNLKPKLRAAANRLMHDLFNVEEDNEASERKLREDIEQRKSGLQGWVKRLESIKERMKKGGSRQGLTQAETQVGVWGDILKRMEDNLAAGRIPKRVVRSSYYKEAAKLSGTTGDYWRRPNELFARSFESYVFDKISKEGFVSQYLVQGVEPNRFGNGFRGNPYPSGEERERINADYDRVVRALAVGTGKLGAETRLQSAEGEPEPVVTVTKVTRPASQPSMVDEVKAVDQGSKSLSDAFADHFKDGKGFSNILQARKFAREHTGEGATEDVKATEEALEFGIVKAARANIEASETPQDAYKSLVSLYASQPRLGTRTSTSVRDQAYSTPVPLAYVASKLAGITKKTTVYEPTAGNGALLIDADPAKVRANELNPQRRANLGEQGFMFVTANDASEGIKAEGGMGQVAAGEVDRVIANPPFGSVKEGESSKRFDMGFIQPGYETNEIDHVIALRSLDAMRDDGRAVLLLGGLNKQLTTEKARSDGYNSKAKREFYKTLYDHYNVTDHFTVDGDLYERQGAGWPVDVVVIHGRGKSARALPAVDVPRIYSSWDALGGLIDGLQSDAGNDRGAERPDAGASGGTGRGLAGRGGRDRGDAGGQQSGPVEPAGVREEHPAGTEAAGGSGDEGPLRPEGSRLADRTGEQPAAERSPSGLSDDDISSFVGDAIEEAYGATPQAEQPRRERPSRERTTGETAKSAAKNTAEGVDEAFTALFELFGGGKTIGMGLNVDEATYAKAKPHFRKTAEKFRDVWGDLRELARRMVAHMRDVLKWPQKIMQELSPYLEQFFKDIRDGKIKLGEEEKPAAPRERAESKAEETEGQVKYTPQSTMPGLDTLVPTNMRSSIADSLKHLEDRVGKVDTFVAKELGYKDEADLAKHFGAEQVDALGLAIDNIKRGRGFIIGDQTGIGKGRVNAAIIKWAIQNGRIPVFVTATPDLYADIYRDMKDIGMFDSGNKPVRMLATNAAKYLPLEEGRGGLAIDTDDAKTHNLLLARHADKRAFDENYDLVLTNYSQMQTLKGEDTARRQFLQAIAPHAVIIMDESHNAGGQKKARKEVGPADRAGFARGLIEAANGVFYSSATYAKRPDVMDLYAATDMVMAVDDVADLAEAISRGGVPMQQAVASMLAKGGQYIRRERSFKGITYNTPSVPVDRKNYNDISNSMAAIQDFSRIVASVTERISEEIKGEAGATGFDNATGDAGASSTNFTALMHNIINQMLLAMKVGPASKAAIEAIKRGEKPVLTVANTMEGFLKNYTDTLELKTGDPIEADFADVLHKYLERSRTITIKKPFAKKGEAIKHVLTDEELGKAGVAAYKRAKETISDLDLSSLPISPIDHLKDELKKAGYSVGEITGRTLGIDYNGDKPVLRSRPGAELTTKGRNETRAAFNRKPENGGHHAIVINQAGSTGISMHSNKTFDDQSKRHMFIVQPEGNIDTHMQLLGRVNRTGQVVLPEYSQFVADIPAEKRPAAVLAKKMASLNANTTASRTSAVTSKDVPDFINQYGDEVAANFMADNPELNYRLDFPVKISDKTGKPDKVDAMRRLTGRIPLRPLDEQEEIYRTLEDEYEALLEQLNATGENALEAKTLDLKAKALERTEVQGERNTSNSPFAAPVVVEKVNVARIGKPFKPVELQNRLAKVLDQTDAMQDERHPDEKKLFGFFNGLESEWSPVGKKAAKIQSDIIDYMMEKFDDYRRPILDEIADKSKHKSEMERLNAIKDRWVSTMNMLRVGSRVTLRTVNGNLTGFVMHVEQKGEPKNPLALGSWKATVAVSDATRQVTLPFSRLVGEGKADPESMLDVELLRLGYERPEGTIKRFEMMQHEAREDRYIATGNLLAAYDWLSHKGSIINYTTDTGEVRQGILTPRQFDLEKHAVEKGRVLTNPEEVKTWLEKNPTETVWSKNQIVSIRRESPYSDRYVIQTDKAKKSGGPFYLDKQLLAVTGDFYSRGGQMITDVSRDRLVPAVKRMQEIGAQFSVKTAAPKAQKVSAATSSGPLTPAAEASIPKISDLLTQIVRQIAGPKVKVDFNRGLIQNEGERTGYGDLASAKHEGDRGFYQLADPLIRLALVTDADSMITAATHEAYHHIENKLASEQENALMKAETPRLREYLKKRVKGTYTPKAIDSFAGYEVRAHAFEHYAFERAQGKETPGAGMHVGVRRWFDRLWQALRRLANGLRGLGFKTWEDIFNSAYTGEFAGRWPQMGKGIDVDSLSAIYRRKAGAAVTDSLNDLMKQTTANKLVERFQNLSESVKRLEDAVEARMDGTLPGSEAFYTKKRLFPGKVGNEINEFNKKHLDPLVDMLKKNNVSFDDIGELLYARHAEERNAAMDKINPGLGGAGSGMTDADAQDILNAWATRKPLQNEIVKRVGAIRDYILDFMESHGLESPETIQAWRDQYSDYVPLSGWEADHEEDTGAYREPGKFNVRGREVRQALGRTSRADNPLANLLDQAYRTIERGKKNEYLQALKLALSELDDADLKGFVRFDRGAPRRKISKATGLVISVPDNSFRFKPETVTFKVGGREHYMIFENRQLAEAIKQMHAEGLGMLQPLVTLQNKIKALWTHYSPEFLVRHFLSRYPIEGTINSIEYGGVTGAAKYLHDAFPFLGHASKAIFASNRGVRHSNPEIAQMQDEWDLMRRHGGAIMFRQSRDMDLTREHLKRKLDSIRSGPLRTVQDKWRAAVESMDVVTNALDNATRLAAFHAALQQGASPQEAALRAREATVDFQLSGKWKNGIGLVFPFGNVAIQTGTRMTSAMARSRTMRRVFMGMMLTGFLSTMYNYLVGGDDEDGIPFMDKIPPWERRLNLTVLTPVKDAKGRPIPLHIPVPYNWAFPMTAGSAIATMIFSKNKHKAREMGAMVTKSGIEVMTPFGQEENLAAILAPEIARPFIHAYTNEDYTGRAVHRDKAFQRGPDSESGFRNTGQGWKFIASEINSLSGGSKNKSGVLDFYPEDYRLMFNYLLGAESRTVQNTYNAATDALAGKPTDLSHVPLARVFLGTDYDAANRARRRERQNEDRRPWLR